MARGKHLFPFRTEQLSPSAPMVLGSQGPGRVGRRRFLIEAAPKRGGLFRARTPERGGRTHTSSAGTIEQLVHDLVRYLRANPQVLVLLVICVVLGLGTAIVVLYGIVSSGSTTTTGQPDG